MHAIMQNLHNKIYETWILLMCTCIGHLWRQVFRGSWDGDELASLKSRLYRIGNSLGMVLMALHSYVLFSIHASPNTERLEVCYG